MLLKIQEHQLAWQAWRDSTLHVRVTLAEEHGARAPPEPAGAGAPTAERGTNVADPFMVALPYTLPEADGSTFWTVERENKTLNWEGTKVFSGLVFVCVSWSAKWAV